MTFRILLLLLAGLLVPSATLAAGCTAGAGAYTYNEVNAGSDTSNTFSLSVTFTAEPANCGQYFNGDWWFEGPVTVTTISPTPTGSGSSIRNGYIVNQRPECANNPFDGQESRLAGSQAATGSDAKACTPSLNFTLTPASGEPIVLLTSDSKGSKTYSNDVYIGMVGAWTVVHTDDVPGDTANTFRPAYFGWTKDHVNLTISNIDLTRLATLSTSGFTEDDCGDKILSATDWGSGDPWDWAEMQNLFRYPQIDHVAGWTGRFIHPEDNYGGYEYGIHIMKVAACMMVWANTDAFVYATTSHKDALHNFLQSGIDAYSIRKVRHTGVDGGHALGRKAIVSFTASLFNDSTMKSHITTSTNYDEDNHLVSGSNGVVFGRDNELNYWKTLAHSETDKCGFSGTSPVLDLRDPTGQTDGSSPGTSYQSTTAGPWTANWISIRSMWDSTESFMPTTLGGTQWLGYVYRYYNDRAITLPDTCVTCVDCACEQRNNGTCLTGTPPRFAALDGTGNVADLVAFSGEVMTTYHACLNTQTCTGLPTSRRSLRGGSVSGGTLSWRSKLNWLLPISALFKEP